MTDTKTETAPQAKKDHCGTKSESSAPAAQAEKKKEGKRPSGAGCCG